MVSQPAMFNSNERTNGLGVTTFTAFLAPAVPRGLIWGVGPVLRVPTDTNGLGNKNSGPGASAVVLELEQGNPWFHGVLVNNVWSLSGSGRGGAYSSGILQPCVNYNVPQGFYLTSAPIATVAWKADSGQQRTLPLGGGIGKICHLGKLPGETAALRLPQPRVPRLWCELADSGSGAVHVPEVSHPS